MEALAGCRPRKAAWICLPGYMEARYAVAAPALSSDVVVAVADRLSGCQAARGNQAQAARAPPDQIAAHAPPARRHSQNCRPLPSIFGTSHSPDEQFKLVEKIVSLAHVVACRQVQINTCAPE